MNFVRGERSCGHTQALDATVSFWSTDLLLGCALSSWYSFKKLHHSWNIYICIGCFSLIVNVMRWHCNMFMFFALRCKITIHLNPINAFANPNALKLYNLYSGILSQGVSINSWSNVNSNKRSQSYISTLVLSHPPTPPRRKTRLPT